MHDNITIKVNITNGVNGIKQGNEHIHRGTNNDMHEELKGLKQYRNT